MLPELRLGADCEWLMLGRLLLPIEKPEPERLPLPNEPELRLGADELLRLMLEEPRRDEPTELLRVGAGLDIVPLCELFELLLRLMKLPLDDELLRLGENVLRGVELLRPVPNVEFWLLLGRVTVLRVLLSRLPKVLPLREGALLRCPLPKVVLPELRLMKLPLRLLLFTCGWRRAVPNDVMLLGLPLKPCP